MEQGQIYNNKIFVFLNKFDYYIDNIAEYYSPSFSIPIANLQHILIIKQFLTDKYFRIHFANISIITSSVSVIL